MTNNEGLGPAERIVDTLLRYSDHMMHNRPGAVVPAPGTPLGVRWFQVTHKEEEGAKTVFRVEKQRMRGGKSRERKTRIGTMNGTNEIREAGRVIGRYQPAGIFEEIAVWKYRQFAEVWKVDNEFAAKFASYVYRQDDKDMKVVAAAFMLCQTRKGDPIMENGELAFFDDDYRDVGEAMCLLYGQNNKKAFDPKLLLRIRDVLYVPGVAEINRDLGFTRSRKPMKGRWEKVVQKWLSFREDNPRLLESAVKAGWTSTIRELVRASRYKPKTPRFFEVLKWKQAQSKRHASRELIIGEVQQGESWDAKSEQEICELIEKEKPSWKIIASKVPTEVGITRAVLACAIENGCLSNKDLIIQTPTIEELGLLDVQSVKELWQEAMRQAEDTRARNIARNVKNKATKEELEAAADTAVKKAVEKAEEETERKFRVYIVVDTSSSMQGAIDRAKGLIEKFVQAFPADRLHVSHFNTHGKEVELKRNTKGEITAASVRQAFRGIRASGGTRYSAGVDVLAKHRLNEDEEALFIFIGDEEGEHSFAQEVRATGLQPVAFGLVRVVATLWAVGAGATVRNTARALGIPCFMIEEETFDDPYAIPRTIQHLIAATPVATQVGRPQAAPRKTLVDIILETELLKKPAWACPEVVA